ncbi:MAG: PP2C family serine/threonine-protein phosphatase [Candidatus Eremiobacteraeota bacterium]|nr:PP2C family serine/threonine-protein phosphatase [Candidatus Eremiobacteraeota bacterium]
MDQEKFDIVAASRTFTYPGIAETRVCHFLKVNSAAGSKSHALFAMAEGSGDAVHPGEICLDTIKESAKTYYFDESYFIFDESEKLEDKIREVFTEINRTLYSLHKTTPGMRAAVLMGIVHDDSFFLGRGGTSRALLIREGALQSLTLERTAGQSAPGKPSQVPAPDRSPSFRNWLGSDPAPLIEIYKIKLRQGDTILFLSDGISEELRDSEILALAGGDGDFGKALQNIITLCTDRGGTKDTAILGLRASTAIAAEIGEEIVTARKPALQVKGVTVPSKATTGRRNILVLLLSAIVTVILGLSYIVYVEKQLTKPPMTVMLRTQLPLAKLLWLKTPQIIDGDTFEFRIPCEKDADILLEPKKGTYCSAIVLIMARPFTFEGNQSLGKLEKNEVYVTGGKVTTMINIFSRLEPAHPESASFLQNNERLWSMKFEIWNLKAPLEIITRKNSELREIQIQVRPMD